MRRNDTSLERVNLSWEWPTTEVSLVKSKSWSSGKRRGIWRVTSLCVHGLRCIDHLTLMHICASIRIVVRLFDTIVWIAHTEVLLRGNRNEFLVRILLLMELVWSEWLWRISSRHSSHGHLLWHWGLLLSSESSLILLRELLLILGLVVVILILVLNSLRKKTPMVLVLFKPISFLLSVAMVGVFVSFVISNESLCLCFNHWGFLW